MSDPTPNPMGRRVGNVILGVTLLAGLIVALVFCWNHFGPPAKKQLFDSTVDSVSSSLAAASDQDHTTPADQVRRSQQGNPPTGIISYLGTSNPGTILSADRDYSHLQVAAGGRTACIILGSSAGDAGTTTAGACPGKLTQLR